MVGSRGSLGRQIYIIVLLYVCTLQLFFSVLYINTHTHTLLTNGSHSVLTNNVREILLHIVLLRSTTVFRHSKLRDKCTSTQTEIYWQTKVKPNP